MSVQQAALPEERENYCAWAFILYANVQHYRWVCAFDRSFLKVNRRPNPALPQTWSSSTEYDRILLHQFPLKNTLFHVGSWLCWGEDPSAACGDKDWARSPNMTVSNAAQNSAWGRAPRSGLQCLCRKHLHRNQNPLQLLTSINKAAWEALY